jgi:hypothetical protein
MIDFVPNCLQGQLNLPMIGEVSTLKAEAVSTLRECGSLTINDRSPSANENAVESRMSRSSAETN